MRMSDRYRIPRRRVSFLFALAALVAPLNCARQTFGKGCVVLLFRGTGTSPNDVQAIESLLKSVGIHYSTIDAKQLRAATESHLLECQLLIVPGGNYLHMADGLSEDDISKIRIVVQRGLNYLGICAGAILAGQNEGKCLNLTSGVKFGFYSDVNRNVHKNVVAIETANGEKLDQYWEDGPQLNGWGKVISRYPDGSAATVQGKWGKGGVILCGFHPEAPASWRAGMTFTTSLAKSQSYALTLIYALLNGNELHHF
ncbi:MAG: BPL-N domain-containing protein [Planctomycetota bacterium]